MPRLRKKKKILSPAQKKPQKKKQVTVIQPQVSIRCDHQVKKREPVPPKRQELPDNYGDNHIYLMVRDSHWLYAYWEIQKDHQEKYLALLGGEWSRVKSILRVYDTTSEKERPGYFDIFLEGLANHWYIHARPNRSFVIEIGLLHNDGRFVVLARSNEQTTPRDGMSEILDEEWMGIDFDKMYALSGGFEVGKSSLELKKLMEKRLWGAISSGSGVSQISSVGAR